MLSSSSTSFPTTSILETTETKQQQLQNSLTLQHEEEETNLQQYRLDFRAREASIGEGFEIGFVSEDVDEGSNATNVVHNSSQLLTSFHADERRQDQEDIASVASSSDREAPTTTVSPPTKKNPVQFPRPVLYKRASVSIQAPGEGVEVADWNEQWRVDHHSYTKSRNHAEQEEYGNTASRPRSASFDQTMSYDRVEYRLLSHSRKNHRRSLSEGAYDDAYHAQVGADAYFFDAIAAYDYYDPWEYEDYYHQSDDGTNYINRTIIYQHPSTSANTHPFRILGTHAHDTSCHPHVLSPPLMATLLQHMPYQNQHDNLWLRYSLVRDGASRQILLEQARGIKSPTLLALETVEGEVLGCCSTSPWQQEPSSFPAASVGSPFLWRLRQSRHHKTWSLQEQTEQEQQVDVYAYYHYHDNRQDRGSVQLCNDARMVMGGIGESAPNARSHQETTTTTLPDGTTVYPNEWGFGLCFDGNVLLEGTSSPCLSFMSPALSRAHPDGSVFEIVNLELWALTPCLTEENAEQLRQKHVFLEENMSRRRL